MKTTLLNLKIRNFLSFGNNITDIDLSQAGAYRIHGENRDTESANGVGKTTIINAIAFAIYGKSINGISKERLINTTNKSRTTEMLVQLSFDLNGDIYEVIRRRGKSTEIIVTKDGNDITPDSVSNADKFIESLFGVSFELFKRTAIFSGSDISFFELGAGKQKDIVEELLRIFGITEKADKLKVLIKDVEKDIAIKEAVIQQQEQAKALHEKHITDSEAAIENWEVENTSKIDQFKKDLDALKNINFDEQIKALNDTAEINTRIKTAEQDIVSAARIRDEKQKSKDKDVNALESINNNIDTMEARVKELEVVDIESQKKWFKEREATSTMLSEETSKVSSSERVINRTKEIIEELSKELSHLEDDKCPYCLQSMEDTDKKIAELKEKIKTEEALVSKSEDDITGFNKLIDELSTKVAEYDEKVQYKSFESIVKDETEYAALLKAIDDTPAAKESLEAEIKGLSIEIHEAEDERVKHKDELNAALAEYDAIKNNIDLVFKSADEAVATKSYHDNLKEKITDAEKESNPHTQLLESYKKESVQEIDYKGFDALQDNLKHHKFLLKLLSDKNSFIRKKIINNHISYLNKRLQTYLYEMGLPHMVHFGADLKCKISEHGRELDYGNLSGGEKQRLTLSLSLAFRDVMLALHNNINVLFTDEIDGGRIDSAGIDSIIRIIKRKVADDNIGAYIISHRPECNDRFDKEIYLVKENGFTNVVDR